MSKTNDYIIDLHNLTEEVKELKEDKQAIYEMVADLWDYVNDSDYLEREHILEELQNIQVYAK